MRPPPIETTTPNHWWMYNFTPTPPFFSQSSSIRSTQSQDLHLSLNSSPDTVDQIQEQNQEDIDRTESQKFNVVKEKDNKDDKDDIKDLDCTVNQNEIQTDASTGDGSCIEDKGSITDNVSCPNDEGSNTKGLNVFIDNIDNTDYDPNGVHFLPPPPPDT